MTLVIISFDVLWAAVAKNNQSFVTSLVHPHERMFSGPFVQFQPAMAGSLGPASTLQVLQMDAKELEVMGTLKIFWWLMAVCCVSIICLNHPIFRVSYLVRRFLS